MVIGVFFLHGAVESFTVGVLFRCFRACLVVGEVERVNRRGKVFLELRAVVGEDGGVWEREYLPDNPEEFRRCERGMRGGCERKAEACVEINEGDDVSP